MKRTFVLVLSVLALVCALPSFASFKIGPRLGINVNQLHFNKAILDGENRCGFTGGLQVEYLIPKVNFGFDVSLMYAYMDLKANMDDNSLTQDVKPDFGKHFLEIPLNLKYKFTIPAVSKFLSPYIFTGPSASFRLDKDGGSFKTKTVQWNWNLGVGLELIKHLQVGASYGWGINNLMKDVNVKGLEGYTTDNLKMRNDYWTVTLAWLF